MNHGRRKMLAGSIATALWATVPPATGQFLRRRSILEFIPRSHHEGIRNRTSSYDCTQSLQRAVDATAIAGETLLIPAGVYYLTPKTVISDEDVGGVCLGAIVMRAGMTIDASPGAILRIADAVSSDRNPQSMALFCTDRPISHITIVGLTMDMNGSANPISPGRRSQLYGRQNQSQILVSGTSQGVAARIDNARIERCRFLNTAGVCCVVMAQSNVPNVRLGRGWLLVDNEFRDNGIDTDDHTSVYGWADDVVFTGNRFYNSLSVGIEQRSAGNTCYEVHGSNHVISGNEFRGYFRGIWVASNNSTPVNNTRISGNSFEVRGFGIDFFGDQAPVPEITNTLIERNRFVLSDERGLIGIDLRACIQVGSRLAQRQILMSNNSARTTSKNRIATAFAVITGGGAAKRVHDQITISDNQTDGLTFGAFIRTSSDVGLGSIAAQRNDWLNLTPAGAYSIAVGVSVEHTFRLQSIASLSLGGGAASGAPGLGARAYAIRVNAQVAKLDIADIKITNIALAYWEDTQAVVKILSGIARP